MSWPWKITLALVWGLALGSAAALGAGTMLVGGAWLYLYGDDPWPDTVEESVLIGAAAAGLLTCAATIAAFMALPRLSPSLDRWLQASAAYRWTVLAIPLLLAAGAVAAYARQQATWAAERAAAERQERDRAEAHRLTGAAWRMTGAEGTVHLGLVAIGATPAAYDLRWEARGPGFPQPIQSGATKRQLPAGPAMIELDLDARALARSYAEHVLTRSETVEIDLPLSVHLTLVRQSESGSESRLVVTLPLSYRYEPGGLVTFAQGTAGQTP